MKDRILPGCNPLISVTGYHAWRDDCRLIRNIGIFGKFRWEDCTWINRIHEHLKWHILLEWNIQHEINKLLSQLSLLGSLENSDKLYLSETHSRCCDRSCWRFS